MRALLLISVLFITGFVKNITEVNEKKAAGSRSKTAVFCAHSFEAGKFKNGNAPLFKGLANMEGGIAPQQGQYAGAGTGLKKAVTIEDNLMYTEQPDCFFSMGHRLGHELVRAKKFTKAEMFYRQGLRKHPQNGWAPIGLNNSPGGHHKIPEVNAVNEQFRRAWQWADINLSAPRLH